VQRRRCCISLDVLPSSSINVAHAMHFKVSVRFHDDVMTSKRSAIYNLRP
jgi:hypothetical protein